MRVIALCPTQLNGWQMKFLNPFFDSNEHRIVACIIDDRPPKTLLNKFITNLKKGRGGYILVMAVERLFAKKVFSEGTSTLFQSMEVPVIHATDPYSDEVVGQIKEFNPEVLILVGGFGIIKKPLLDVCKNGVLSYHGGDMRKYRGQPGGFWEIYNGEKEGMVTVQRLSEGLDQGEPIVERRIRIAYTDTVKILEERIYEESTDMMYQAVGLISSKGYVPQRIERYGDVYTIPNLSQWLILKIKVLSRSIKWRINQLVR